MIIEYKKDKNYSEKLKILGITVYEKEEIRNEKRYNFLSNLIKYYRYTPYEKYFKIFNIPIFKILDFKNYKKLYLFSNKNYKNDLKEEFFRNITSNIDEKYKNIVLIRSAIGETYLLNLFMEQYLENNSISAENTCFIGRRSEYADLFHLFNPNLNYITTSFDLFKTDYLLDCEQFNIQNRNIFIYVNKQFIFEINKKRKCQKIIPMCEELYSHFKIDKNKIKYPSFNFNDNIEKSIKQKLPYLNYKKFVILIPEARSIQKIDLSFWKTLKTLLYLKGYSIYENFVDSQRNNPANLSLEELVYLAQRCKGIIGLSSGCIELLSIIKNIPIDILYTKANVDGTGPEIMQLSFSKKTFPLVTTKMIQEYIYTEKNKEKIIKQIIRRY